MNKMLVLIVLVVFTAQFSLAQTSVSPKLKLTNTRSFFEQFIAKKQPSEKGEFETKEEYERRMSKYIADTFTVFYFKIDVTPESSFKNYQYDIDAHKLTVTGGKCISYDFHDYTPPAHAVIIQSRGEDKGTYKASNAYGKTVTVKKSYLFDYVLGFDNTDVIPDSIFDASGCTFSLSISKVPKEAERLSKGVALAVGVKVLGYQHSGDECVQTMEPKIDAPYEIAQFSSVIEVKFVELVLYDTSSKEILSRFKLSQ